VNAAADRLPRRGLLLPTLLTVAAAAVLIALGTWQLERKQWKEGLIAALEQRLAAAPVNLPPRETWPRLTQASDEFRRVTFPAEFLPGEEALVYASGSALRPDVSGPGYWVFAPARLPGGSIVAINRGFVPEGRQEAKSRPQGQPSGVVDVVGVMRWPEARGLFTPDDDPARNLWFVRDHAAIAAAKAWGSFAPFHVDQEAPPAPGGLPRAAALKPSLPNNHLQYALTWYGLTVVLLGVFVAFWRASRRDAKAAEP
jgi:surfeit locus 1 family protein